MNTSALEAIEHTRDLQQLFEAGQLKVKLAHLGFYLATVKDIKCLGKLATSGKQIMLCKDGNTFVRRLRYYCIDRSIYSPSSTIEFASLETITAVTKAFTQVI